MTTCPVCKAKAEEIELGTIDGKIFRCPKHGDFAVANSVFCVSETRERERALVGGGVQKGYVSRSGKAAPENPHL